MWGCAMTINAYSVNYAADLTADNDRKNLVYELIFWFVRAKIMVMTE